MIGNYYPNFLRLLFSCVSTIAVVNALYISSSFSLSPSSASLRLSHCCASTAKRGSTRLWNFSSFLGRRSTTTTTSPTTKYIPRRTKATTTITMTMMEYAPSQIRIDVTTGEKWRLCAGTAVLNSQNRLLVGKRIGNYDSPQWQCPQGGVDDSWTPKGHEKEKPKETIMEACHRELYEEMGLQVGKHVMVDDVLTPDHQNGKGGIQYRTTGTNSWLTKAGFAGQELYWTIYRCIDGRGDFDPSMMCDLSGMGGEKPEFSNVEWQTIDDVVDRIWEKKREPYTALKNQIHGGDDNKSKSTWDEKILSLDFTGRWTRDNNKCVDVVDGLTKRGLSPEDAKREASKPYIQSFDRFIDDDDQTPGSWLVTTYDVDGITVRRKLQYRVGEWKEDYQGNAVIFGGSSSSSSNDGEGSATTTLVRRTSYVAEPDSQQEVAHVTITHDGPRGGIEESRRYLRQGKMILRRTFWPEEGTDDPVVSTEVFSRIGE